MTTHNINSYYSLVAVATVFMDLWHFTVRGGGGGAYALDKTTIAIIYLACRNLLKLKSAGGVLMSE